GHGDERRVEVRAHRHRVVALGRALAAPAAPGREQEDAEPREAHGQSPFSLTPSRRPSSFIFSWSPLREILSRRAAWVTFPPVWFSARLTSSRSSRLIATFTCSFRPPSLASAAWRSASVTGAGGIVGGVPRTSCGKSW